MDILLLHWNWQYPLSRGAQWCFRKWVCTSSLVLPQSRLPAVPVSMGPLQLQDRESKASFNAVQFSWHENKNPRSCPVEPNLESLKFSRVKKDSDTTSAHWSSKKRNSTTFLSLSQFFFLPTVANTKPQTHVGAFMPAVALGVHHKLSKWLLLQSERAVPAVNKEGYRGYCSNSVVSGREPLQFAQGRTAHEALLSQAIFTRLNQT